MNTAIPPITRREALKWRRKRPSTITMPANVGPYVRLVFGEMRRLNITYDELEIGSGVRRAALKAWRHKNKPGLDSIEAVLGFLGYDFVPIPRAKILPPELVAELTPIAEKYKMTAPQASEALVAIVAGIHTRFGSAPPTAPEIEDIAAHAAA